MFNAFRRLMEGVAEFAQLLNQTLKAVLERTDDPIIKAKLAPILEITEILFRDGTGDTIDSTRWTIIPAEREILKGHNAYWRFVRAVNQTRRGLPIDLSKTGTGKEAWR